MAFQAAPERDIDLRSKAVRLAEDLRDKVRGMFSDQVSLNQLAQHGAVRLDTTLLPGAVPGLDAPVDVTAVFLPIDLSDPRRVGAASGGPPPAFALFLLPPFDYPRLMSAVRNPRNPRHREAQFALIELQRLVDQWFDRNLSAVVHELIHLFDFIRADTVGGRYTPPRSRQEYVSDPWEYNAHFQHMLVELGDDLQKAPGWVQNLAYENFEAFVAFAERTRAGRGFLPHLTPKYRKKALSRLWQTWDHFRRRTQEGES